MLDRNRMMYLILVVVLVGATLWTNAAVRATNKWGIDPIAAAPEQTSLPNEPLSPTAGGWIFTNVATVGQNGFTSLSNASVGDNGLIAVYGTRHGKQGIFAIQNTNVITVATVGTVLSGTLGTIDYIDSLQIGIDPNSRVIFVARVAGSTLPPPANASRYPAFRWSNGVISHMLPSASNVSHFPSAMNRQGQWLADAFVGTFPNGTHSFQITDGAIVTPVVGFVESGINCDAEKVSATSAPNANGAMLYYKWIHHRANPAPGICDPEEFTRVWTLGLAGTISSTVANGQLTDFNGDNNTNGTNVSGAGAYHLNDNGDVVYLKNIYINAPAENAPTNRQLILRDGSGETVLLENLNLLSVSGFDNAKRVAFGLYSDSEESIYAGPNLQTDRVISAGDTLFGQTTSQVRLLDVNAPPGIFGDQRTFVFEYEFADGTRGIALASKGVTRWTNSAGGLWTTAANWTPAEVPGAATETLFNLEATYDVSVGTRTSGRSRIENGNVSFRNAALTLIGPLAIGSDAKLTLPEGTLHVGEITIGHLPPISPLTPTLAQLNLLNAGTRVTNTGSLKVGHAGEGEVFVGGGRMVNAEVLIGAGSAGTLTVGGLNALLSTGNLAVGSRYTGTLNIERDARVFSGEVVIGQGIAVENHLATVNLDASGSTIDTSWTISDTLTLGNQLPAELMISHGGNLGALGLIQAGLKAHPSRGSLFDALLTIEGTGTLSTTPSALYAFTDMLLGLDSGVRVSASVLKGGALNVSGNLSVGHETGSNATMTVAGFNSNGARSTIDVGTNLGPEQCNVGFKGNGGLLVREGGRLECSQMRIGVLSGSTGYVLVSGEEQEVPSTFTTDGLLCLGSGTACDAGNETNVHGTLELDESAHIIIGRGTVIGNGGRIIGRGEIAPGALGLGVFGGGSIDPGVSQGLNPRLSAATPQSPLLVIPGKLIISGSLTFSPTASLVLDVIGKNNNQFDRLVVNGSASLDGRLELRFSNGFAPRQGDAFTFIQSDNSSGSFDEVVIKGVAPGFEYTLNTVGGVITLTALNDGVPTTQVERFIYLPLLVR